MAQVIRKTFQVYETKAADNAPHTLIAKISNSSPDRSRDVVVPRGMIADNFVRNPVVQLFHNYSYLPISKAEDIQITDDGVLAKVVFPQEGTYSWYRSGQRRIVRRGRSASD